MRTNTTKAKLKAGETVLGCFVRYPDATLVEILGYYGWDFFLLDAEHSPLLAKDAENLARACELRNVTPIIRVPTNLPHEILRLMDVGMMGAQIPMINTKAEAQAAVNSVKFQPRGTRGLAGSRAANFGQIQPFSFAEYTVESNAETMVIAQVETVQAVENLEQILQVPDIDAIFIGPTDLSNSLGHPGDVNHPLVQETFNRIIETIKPTGIAIGTLVPNLEAAQKWRDRGATYLMITMEAILGPACRNFIKEMRN